LGTKLYLDIYLERI